MAVMKNVYLDNNATTKTAEEVVEAMMPYFSENYGNPSSMHNFGGKIGRDVAKAREQVAAFINAGSGSATWLILSAYVRCDFSIALAFSHIT